MSSIQSIKVMKSDPNAIVPFKHNKEDVGYDLTIIKKSDKPPSGKTILYNTGIRVIPPPGYYTTVVPRSSIYKSGYMLANSEGIIDPLYRGDIHVPLIKVDETKPDLELPFRGFQLILKKFEEADIELNEEAFLEETKRGDGGFGSTG